MAAERGAALAEWRRGWPVVLTGAVGYGVGTFHLVTLGNMVKPLEGEFGWSRGQVTGVLSLIGVTALVIGPLVGLLADRIGARRIALAGVVLYSAGLASIGFTSQSIWTWYLSWAVMSVLWPAMSPALWTTGVVGFFRSSRGLALGATLCGTGLAAMLCPPFAVWTIENFGWRQVYFFLAAGGLALLLPMTWFCFKDVRSTESGATEAEPPSGYTLKEAARTRRFWTLGLAMFVTGLMVAGVSVHMQPMFTDKGVSAADAAKLVALTGPTLILGRTLIGLLLDRSRSSALAAAIIAVPILGLCLLLGYEGSLLIGAVVVFSIAIAYGAEIDICAFMASRYFGLKAYSAITSAMVGLLTIGAGLGPAILGRAFDLTGSYHGILLTLIVAMVLAVLLVLSLGSYPPTAAGRPSPIRRSRG